MVAVTWSWSSWGMTWPEICRLRSWDDYNSAQFWVISLILYTHASREWVLFHIKGFKYDISASDFVKSILWIPSLLYPIPYQIYLKSSRQTSTHMSKLNSLGFLSTPTPFFLISVNGPIIYCCSRQKLGGYPWCFILLHLPIKTAKKSCSSSYIIINLSTLFGHTKLLP